MKTALITAFLVLALAGMAFAEGRGYTSKEYPWVMRSVASLGMGDANYVKSNSKYAPFYNPAGLARIKEWKVDIIPVTAGANTNIIKFYEDYKDIDSDNDSQVAQLLSKHIGELEHADVSVFPAFAKKNFMFGIFTAGQVNAYPSNPVLPELNVNITADGGAVVGVATSFLKDKLQVGISGRYQMRYSYAESFTFYDIANGELQEIDFDDAKKGQGVFADIGAIYNFWTDGLNPRVGLAANNLGMNDLGDAEDLPYSFTISAGISPSWSFIGSDIMIDVRDITRNYDEDNDWGKRVNLGAEVRFWDIVALRGGFHQGYPTYGVGLDFHYFKLDYAHYYEEIGAYAGQEKDERHALELALGF